MLILFNVGIQFSYHHLLRRDYPFPLYSLSTFVNEKAYFWALYCLYFCLYASTIMGIFKIFFFLQWWVFLAARGLSLVVVSGGYSLLQCTDFSLWWLLSCCRAQALGMEGQQL